MPKTDAKKSQKLPAPPLKEIKETIRRARWKAISRQTRDWLVVQVSGGKTLSFVYNIFFDWALPEKPIIIVMRLAPKNQMESKIVCKIDPFTDAQTIINQASAAIRKDVKQKLAKARSLIANQLALND